MILILDAHALVWWLADDPELTDDARSAIRDPGNDVVVSSATVWELAIKRARGRIDIAPHFTDAVEEAGFSSLPVTSADAEHAAALPPHHRDPFDRMLIAQAQRLDALVVTRDAAFRAYDVDVLSA